MRLLNSAHSCLSDIFYKDVAFKLAINNVSRKHNMLRDERSQLTAVVGCALRHYYIFDNIISRTGKEYNQEHYVALFVYLVNRLFITISKDGEIREFLSKFDISKEDIKKIDELVEDKTKLIPEDITSESIDYLHYRFNIPNWILKMWMKHFKGYTYKIVKSINKPKNHYAFADINNYSNEELEKNNDFVKTAFEGLYKYQGNVPPMIYSLFREKKVVLTNPAEYYLLNKLDIDLIRRIGIYVEGNTDLLPQLIGKLSTNLQADIIAGDDSGYFPLKKEIEANKLLNVNLYQANHSSIITCVSEPLHTFIVMPKNTNFAEFRNSPDYFKRIKQEELDGMLINQKSALEDASSFVEPGGQLVYIVPTMDKKESFQIVGEFLNKHPEFVIEEHKQFLPFDKYDSAFYFAILRKANND